MTRHAELWLRVQQCEADSRFRQQRKLGVSVIYFVVKKCTKYVSSSLELITEITMTWQFDENCLGN